MLRLRRKARQVTVGAEIVVLSAVLCSDIISNTAGVNGTACSRHKPLLKEVVTTSMMHITVITKLLL